MRVGDVVIAKAHANPLACGSGIYTHAICVSIDPLVVISEGGDMMWTHKAPYDLVFLCEASPKAQASALRRWEAEKDGVVGVADYASEPFQITKEKSMAEKFDAWGIVELMGHQRAAGRLTEEQIAGSNLLRVDVPTDAHNFRTVYYGASAIYALHVTGEEEARKMAARSGARPPFAYEIEASSPMPRLPLETDKPDHEDEGIF